MVKHSYRILEDEDGEKELMIYFDKKYELLTTFFWCDVASFEDWTKEAFDKVLSGQSEYEELNGNICGVDISPDTTKVYDNLAEDAMGNWCEVDTRELRLLIEEWCDKVKEIEN